MFKVCIVLLIKLMESMSQSVSDIAFRTPMQATSHLKLIDFQPENT